MNLRAAVALAFLAAFLGGGTAPGDAAFQRGDYRAAVREYQRALEDEPASGLLHYNLGAALLRLGRYDEAQRHLAIARATHDAPVRQSAHYNGGNGDLYPALGTAPGPQRDARLRSAITAYREALLLDPDDFDAKWNLELAERLLSQTPGGGGGGGGGGGAGEDPAPAQPTPRPADGHGPEPQMTPAQAEELLEAALDRDRELNEQKLQRGASAPAGVRDW